jgi:hypothetical protein
MPNDQTTMDIDIDDGDGILTVRIVFEGTEQAPLGLSTRLLPPHTVELTLTNFNNSVGASISSVPIGTAMNRLLLLGMAVYSIGKQRVIHYTLYLGAEYTIPATTNG